jgi:hypothetical protein
MAMETRMYKWEWKSEYTNGSGNQMHKWEQKPQYILDCERKLKLKTKYK